MPELELLKAITDHTPTTWSAVAMFIAIAVVTYLSKRVRAPGVKRQADPDLIRDFWDRTKELDEDKDEIRDELDKVKAALHEAGIAMLKAERKLEDRDRRIAELCGEVNEQLRLRNLPDRYADDGHRILITPSH